MQKQKIKNTGQSDREPDGQYDFFYLLAMNRIILTKKSTGTSIFERGAF